MSVNLWERAKQLVTNRKFVKIAIFAIIGITVLTFGINLLLDKLEQSDKLTVNAKITIDNQRFTITIKNNNTYNWTKIDISLVASDIYQIASKYGYTLPYGLMESGKTYTIDLRAFSNSNNNAFNPHRMKVKTVSIVANPPWGIGGSDFVYRSGFTYTVP